MTSQNQKIVANSTDGDREDYRSPIAKCTLPLAALAIVGAAATIAVVMLAAPARRVYVQAHSNDAAYRAEQLCSLGLAKKYVCPTSWDIPSSAYFSCNVSEQVRACFGDDVLLCLPQCSQSSHSDTLDSIVIYMDSHSDVSYHEILSCVRKSLCRANP